MDCPSQLTLEEFLMDGGKDAVEEHVASCEGCTQRLAEMRRLSGEFRRVVYPDTAPSVLASVERAPRLASLLRPPRLSTLLRWLSAPALATAVAACMLLFVGHGPVDPAAPDGGYVGAKGEPITLAVFARTLDGAEPLTDGGRVEPGTALRFEVRAPGDACRLWLVSIDELARVSRLYPPAGAAVPHTGGAVPGGVLLDDRTGPERVFAVCSREPIEYSVVERAARAAARRGVRAARELSGLPHGALQTTVLLEKAR